MDQHEIPATRSGGGESILSAPGSLHQASALPGVRCSDVLDDRCRRTDRRSLDPGCDLPEERERGTDLASGWSQRVAGHPVHRDPPARLTLTPVPSPLWERGTGIVHILPCVQEAPALESLTMWWTP